MDPRGGRNLVVRLEFKFNFIMSIIFNLHRLVNILVGFLANNAFNFWLFFITLSLRWLLLYAVLKTLPEQLFYRPS